MLYSTLVPSGGTQLYQQQPNIQEASLVAVNLRHCAFVLLSTASGQVPGDINKLKTRLF